MGENVLNKFDAILMFALVASSFVWLFISRSGGETANIAAVYADGEPVWKCALNGEGTYSVSGVDVSVSGGAARVISSTCEDHVCMNTGDISRAGEAAICLPNHVSVIIEGGDAPDAVLR